MCLFFSKVSEIEDKSLWYNCNPVTAIIFRVKLVLSGKIRGWIQIFLVQESCYAAVRLLSHVQLFATLWTAACQAPLFLTFSQSWLKFMSIESMMLCNRLILCLPLFLPSVCPSMRVFSNESAPHITWPESQSFSFGISPLERGRR